MITMVMSLGMQTPSIQELQSAVEAVLFAAGDPISITKLCNALGTERKVVREALKSLAEYYQQERRGIRLVRMEDYYQLCTAPDYADVIRTALEYRKPFTFTRPALEALAIIAHYQPATRAYIDQIRGVNSTSILSFLLGQGLIEKCGHIDAPGKPFLYRTTLKFLREFHMESLDELPEMPSSMLPHESSQAVGNHLNELMEYVEAEMKTQEMVGDEFERGPPE